MGESRIPRRTIPTDVYLALRMRLESGEPAHTPQVIQRTQPFDTSSAIIVTTAMLVGYIDELMHQRDAALEEAEHAKARCLAYRAELEDMHATHNQQLERLADTYAKAVVQLKKEYAHG